MPGPVEKLAIRGLAIHAEVEDLTLELLLDAARRSVSRRAEVLAFEL